MLYWIVKPLANIFMRVYYQLEYKGLEKVPFGKPVVLAPNHVNAFVDPVIIAMNPPQKVRFFARGDVFKGRAARWILNSLNISPMYRIQEGYAELKKNDKTFEECRQLLTDNKTILLFPEAICVQERRLRPLKKGLARIVFQTAESLDFSKDILVVPVGLNYSDAKRFRSKVFIDFGDPISVKEYEQRFRLDKVKTINEFTKVLERKMEEHLVVIRNPENDELVTQIEEMFITQWNDDKQSNKCLDRHYQASRDISEMVNYLDRTSPEKILSLKEILNAYFLNLKKYDLRDHLLRPAAIDRMSFATFLKDYLSISFGMIFYVVALITNFPPYYAARVFSHKKIKNVEFFASVYGNLAMVFWIIYYGIQLLVVAEVFRNWWLLAGFAAAVPLLGWYALRFYPVMKRILGRLRLLRMVRKKRDAVEEMVTQRLQVANMITQFKKEYVQENTIKNN